MRLALGPGSVSLVAAGLFMVAGCSTGDAGDEEPPASPEPAVGVPSPEHAAPEPTSSLVAGELSIDEIQRILDDARFDEDELGLTVSETYQRESGLDTPTLAYCGDEVDPSDNHRVARTQRWWLNDAWPSRGDGGYTVGAEIVLYAAGGVPGAMAAFRAVPATCPAAQFDSGSAVDFGSAQVPDGLPPGSAALRDRWTYADGTEAGGFIIAVPVGDVIGFLYIRGDDAAVHARVGELSLALAERIADTDEHIAAGVGAF